MKFALIALAILISITTQAGRIVAWGNSNAGQTNVPPNLTNVVAVASGDWHTLALKGDGTVAVWGGESGFGYGQEFVPPGISNVVAIACGYWHNVVLKGDGTVVSWGWNDFGQTNVPPGLSNVVAIACGSAHSLALRANGTVVAWGNNSDGQRTVPFDLRNVIGIAAGGLHSLALKSDGTITPWGGPPGTTIPASLSNVVSITAGQTYGLALQTNSTVSAWGYGGEGELDIPPGLSNVVAIAARVAHSLALKKDGSLVGWGFNDVGQSSIPARVTNVIAMTTGFQHSVAVIEDNLSATVVRKPISTPILGNQPTLLSAGAVGKNPLTYQWLRDGANLPGATNSWLRLAGVATDRGLYSVQISGGSLPLVATARLRIVFPQLLQKPNRETLGLVAIAFGNQNGLPSIAEESSLYQLQFSTSLASGGQTRTPWQDYSGSFQIQNGRFSITEPTQFATNRFYRVVGGI